MKWSEMSIHTTQEAVEPISNILHEAGASGVVIEDVFDLYKERADVYGEIYQLDPNDYPTEGVIVKAYLPVNSFLGETVDAIKEAINNLLIHDIDLGHNTISVSEVNEEEWATAWKKYYHPVRVSNRITIVPTWEEYTKEKEDELIIELDPGMAFGTGTHPTTVMCIQALEKCVENGDNIIDVGTGSGVLSIAAAKLGASKIGAYDLDDVAVQSARTNVQLNKVDDVVEVDQNNLLSGIEGPVDGIVANLLAEIVLRLVEDAKKVIKPGGYFISSGIIGAKRGEVEEKLVQAGFDVVEVITMEDWVAIIAKA
ncbi:50S ribosomal protein L11 methyltransferase [Priestia taiwanensis]|uniref:Ribosomal protein L11 methyltransferase n=1 Tax=Priestia taiwanensis TaxID=1347902 RepID=A0A917ATP0_9BACI|nr:50S ribosomal protein L11 methyltransferase [Priestia taiwanensis]MBM7363737.1 ribosomal protein L11 methyltransferase [Priestia taiwanensis]GGE74543.1 ribosomal protein L11 methyltransferase [Priestia taiwanensis]